MTVMDSKGILFIKAVRIILLTILLIACISAKTINLKLATAAPKGTCWDLALQEMSQQLELETEGRIKLTIYAGGIVGDESNIVRKLWIGLCSNDPNTAGYLDRSESL